MRADRENSLLDTYVEAVAARLDAILGKNLLGVYLHGSAVLDDFYPERSDVDLIAVCNRPASAKHKLAIADRLSQASLPCPATGLEFHLVQRNAIASLEAPPFELHMATAISGEPDRVVDGRGHPGDSDLVMHFAVLREYGRALLGLAAAEVFPVVPRARLLQAFAEELRWSEQNASASYQVLNACRAWRFLEEGALCSKISRGEWARERADDPATIIQALKHQRGLIDAQPDAERARVFLLDIRRRLEESLAASS